MGSRGTFEAEVTVPAAAAPGGHTLMASCSALDDGGSAVPFFGSAKIEVLLPATSSVPPTTTTPPTTTSPSAIRPTPPPTRQTVPMPPTTAGIVAPTRGQPTGGPPPTGLPTRTDPVVPAVAVTGTGLGVVLLVVLAAVAGRFTSRRRPSAHAAVTARAVAGTASRISSRPLGPGRTHTVRVMLRPDVGTTRIRWIGR